MCSSYFTSSMRQIWCATGVIIGVIGQGMVLGHTTSLLPALLAPDSPIKINIHTASWLVSSTGPALFIGAVFSCALMARFGRRRANLLSLLPGTLGWTAMYLGKDYSLLLIGRILTGISTGAVGVSGAIIISEYTSPRNRGMFLNLKTAAVTIGSAIAHILGNYMHWRTITIVALIHHIIAFLITCTWPESPTWLAIRKRFDECEKEFFWLRGINERSEQEVRELIAAEQKRLSQMKHRITCTGQILEFLRMFTKKDFLKPLLTAIISIFVMEASGRHYFPTYALQIMGDVINNKSLLYYYIFCIDLIIIVGSSLSSVLIRIMKLRTLLFSTGIVSLIALACMCTYLFLISINIMSNNHPWIITIIFIVYFFLVNLACAPVPIAIQSEIFPVAHRESGTAVLILVVSISLTGFLKITPYLLGVMKVYGTFVIFGIVLGTSLFILYFILPETKDRTLQEIENYYNHGRYRVDEEENYETLVKSNH